MERKSRAQLDAMIDKLDADLPDLIADNIDDEEFWHAFSRRTDAIASVAAPEDHSHVHGRVDQMLVEHGVVPDDEFIRRRGVS
jgi:hypothetical protein